MRFSIILSSLTALSLVAGCSSQNAAPPPAGSGKHVDAASAGIVTGRVMFEGTPPKSEPMKMAADPVCIVGNTPNPQSDAVLVSQAGEVQNVFVYVKDGLDPAYSFDTPADAVTLEQKGCRYSPRVLGVRAGQKLEIVNGDATGHNVHALPRSNQEFNRMEQIQGSRMTHTFTVPEVMLRFKCDIHGWMAAYVGVMAHPFFAVTGADGTFALKGLPPGTYTIEAWHEKFGTQTQHVTVGQAQTQAIAFTFAATKS
jgi:plastocyanin